MQRLDDQQVVRALRPDGSVVAEQVRVAKSFRSRLVGLLGTRELPDGHGLLIEPGGGIHTFFMKYAIDVVFLNHSGMILEATSAMAPNRLKFAPRACAAVVEFGAGWIARHGVVNGETLQFAESTDRQRVDNGGRNEC